MNIINFGSLNIDYVYSVDHIVRAGETVETMGRAMFPGGKGLNQSVALARAGIPVFHAGCVGGEGAFLTRYLQENGVDTSCISEVPCPTGHAIIQVDKIGQNCIFLYGGANQQVRKEFIDQVLSQFQQGDILLIQNEISEVGYLIERASSLGLKIAFNPAPFTSRILEYPLDKISYLFLNEIEAASVAGEPDGMIEQIASALETKYPEVTIIITLGSDGSVLLHNGERIYQKIFSVETVDTTGAGDTFVGYFLSGMLRGVSLQDALASASAAAAIAVSREGAAPSIPYADEVIKMLE